jgi:aminodeoxyfutalosine synthase
MPAPVGEPYGLDTLRLFALCRLAAPRVPHVWADVSALGPRLAQMAFGFGADRLYAPIVAERALRLGANANNPALTRKEAATLIRGAGLAACEQLAGGLLEEAIP